MKTKQKLHKLNYINFLTRKIKSINLNLFYYSLCPIYYGQSEINSFRIIFYCSFLLYARTHTHTILLNKLMRLWPNAIFHKISIKLSTLIWFKTQIVCTKQINFVLYNENSHRQVECAIKNFQFSTDHFKKNFFFGIILWILLQWKIDWKIEWIILFWGLKLPVFNC